jgi:hypothetical protein
MHHREELTVDTREELDYLLKDQKNKQVFEQTNDVEWVIRELSIIDEFESDKKLVWKRIIDRHKKRSIISICAPYIAVAAVVLSVIGLYIFRNNNKEKKERPGNAVVTGKKTLPEGSGILTLSDGSSIVLDSIEIGTTIPNGNTSITKTANKEITYRYTGPLINKPDTAMNLLSRSKENQYKLVFTDGTKMFTDTGTTVNFSAAMNGDTRNVHLLKGSVYFEVAPKPQSTFIVHYKEDQIIATGTHFSVEKVATTDSVRATLKEGIIEVVNKSGRKKLTPGQQAMFTHEGDIAVTNNADNYQKAIYWKNGELNFNLDNFIMVMNKLKAYYDIDAEYPKVRIEGYYTGSFIAGTPVSEVLQQLKPVFNIDAKFTGGKIIISLKK